MIAIKAVAVTVVTPLDAVAALRRALRLPAVPRRAPHQALPPGLRPARLPHLRLPARVLVLLRAALRRRALALRIADVDPTILTKPSKSRVLVTT